MSLPKIFHMDLNGRRSRLTRQATRNEGKGKAAFHAPRLSQKSNVRNRWKADPPNGSNGSKAAVSGQAVLQGLICAPSGSMTSPTFHQTGELNLPRTSRAHARRAAAIAAFRSPSLRTFVNIRAMLANLRDSQ